MQPSTRVQAACVLALVLFSAFVTSAHFVWEGSLYWDNLRLYNFAHAQLDSLHRFGEPAWWFPHNQDGFPGYFYAILGDVNAASPAFVLLGAIVWALGRLGVTVGSFQTLYVLHFAVLVPGLFLTGVWLLARQLFASWVVLRWVLVTAAFSPGVLLNISDVGFLEPAAYGLFFAAALRAFVRRPDAAGFRRLALSVGVLAVSFNYTALAWNLLFVPFVLLAAPRGSWGPALGRVRLRQWLGLGALAALAAAPAGLTWLRGESLVRQEVGALRFPLARLAPGNPLEFLAAGTPAVGFAPDYDRGSRPTRQFLPAPDDGQVSYGYLGLLSVPLCAVGLAVGRAPWRGRLFVGLLLATQVVLLSAYSPLFLPLLAPPTPMRSMSHYGDLLYRAGGFLILLFGAGLGLERLLEGGRRLRLTFAWILVLGVAGSAALMARVTPDPRPGTMMGFLLMGGLLLAILWVRIGLEGDGPPSRGLSALLLLLTLADVSTVCFWHIRKISAHTGPMQLDTLRDDGIGLKHPDANWYADALLMLRHRREALDAGLEPASLPPVALYGAAHRCETLSRRDLEAFRASPASLAVEADPATGRSASRPSDSSEGSVRLVRKSYNELEVEVRSPADGWLFVRDSWSPHWRARVNGASEPVVRALGVFKAVRVPAGASTVALRFSRSDVGWALAAAYGALAAAAGLAFSARRGCADPARPAAHRPAG